MAALSAAVPSKSDVWLFDKAKGKLNRISLGGHCHHIEWLSADLLLCDTVVEWPVENPTPNARRDTTSVVWARQAEGKESTASVLDSGIPPKASPASGRLYVIDAKTLQFEEIFRGSLASAYRVSPDSSLIAFSRIVSSTSYVPQDKQPLEFTYTNDRVNATPRLETEFTVIDLKGRVKFAQAAAAVPYGKDAVIWSPDSKRVVYSAKASGPEERLDLYCVDLSTAEKIPESITPKTFIPAANREWQWTRDVGLLIKGRKAGEEGKPSARLDWWLVSGGREQAVTLHLASPLHQLLPIDGEDAGLGIVDGKLLRIGFDGSMTPMASRSDVSFSRILLPRSFSSPLLPRLKATGSWLALQSGAGEATRDWLFNRRSLQLKEIVRPQPKAVLSDLSEANGELLYTTRDGPDGDSVWRSAPGGEGWERIVNTNALLGQIPVGHSEAVPYMSQAGEALHALVSYPPDYKRGKRYPVVVLVYPGTVFSGESSTAESILTNHAWIYIQFLTGKGYLVVRPSMPVPAIGTAHDPLSALPNGVFPTLDKVIEMGVGDPERVSLIGHSYGGFATWGLLTQSQRFKAACASAGLTNFISLYGTFNESYTDFAHVNIHRNFGMLEYGQVGMGVPPWLDRDRYVRNSPITYIDRVTTPLLIVHNDLDYAVNMQQSEEGFRSLQRQGKRAQFVRYWGEDHHITSPANILDVSCRLLAWFDEFNDIKRDNSGRLLWDGDRAMSRRGAPARTVDDFIALDRDRYFPEAK